MRLSIRGDDFGVNERARLRLERRATRVKPYYRSKAHYEALLAEHVRELSKLQAKHYAHNRYAVLVIFQAMDATVMV